uniref:RxLR effector candidate protein n=1 Tax=Hyaloperonospora arabidopsidis (strain Emoy2) TaxID=559515 RepID=M4BPK0_HYAAE
MWCLCTAFPVCCVSCFAADGAKLEGVTGQSACRTFPGCWSPVLPSEVGVAVAVSEIWTGSAILRMMLTRRLKPSCRRPLRQRRDGWACTLLLFNPATRTKRTGRS